MVLYFLLMKFLLLLPWIISPQHLSIRFTRVALNVFDGKQ
ncbi:hypothetical protein GLYMA_19G024750v4 [Glycine max]|nr:hypothetical protein GLYMA_19G024750v4 [Glycine max]KAH1076101.1 hypothetical protein GYH30_051824 [Glycine max]